MSESEAIRFERYEMEWGKYVGKEIGTIDPDYLAWLVEGNTFTDKLKRYILSDRFKKREKEFVDAKEETEERKIKS